MLRALVLVLILANMGVFAWRHGWLGDTLANGDAAREPQRLKAQVHPERLVVVPPPRPAGSAPADGGEEAVEGQAPEPPASAASQSSSASDTPPATVTASAGSTPPQQACLEAGPFTAAEQRQLTPQLGQLPSGAWTTQNVAVQGLWLVYMGPYGDQDTYERKQVELRRIRGLNFEEVRSPANLAMGLSLGRYSQEAQAQAALESLRQRGIRTARVVTVRPAMDLAVVRVPQAGLAVQRVLAGLSLPAGKGFTACARN